MLTGGPYKQREALILLGGIDYKTFIDWCRTARPSVEPLDLEKHPKLKIDRRALWYTRASLERLAQIHGISLLSDEELQQRLPSSDADVNGRLEQLEQRFEQERANLKAELLLAVREEVQRQVQLVEVQIRERVIEVIGQASFSAEVEARLRKDVEEQVAIAFRHLRQEFLQERPQSELPPPATTYRQEGGERQTRVQEGGRPVVTRQIQVLAPTATVKRYERVSNGGQAQLAAQTKESWTAEALFAEGWVDPTEGRLVSKARFAKAHNIPDTNMSRDIQRQVLSMIDQQFLYKGAWKRGGFNAAQRRRAWEEYNGMTWFVPCEICKLNQHQEG